MNSKLHSIVWGICLCVFAVLLVGNMAGILSFSLFFSGWWTLFLIIPGLCGLFSKGSRWGSAIMLLIGIIFLLSAQGVVAPQVVWQLILAIVVLWIGIGLIVRGAFNKKLDFHPHNLSSEKTEDGLERFTSIFGSQKKRYEGEVFEGADLLSVFGNVSLDLRNSVIEQDVTIRAQSIFGGITIKVPDTLNVIVTNGTSIFGGVSNKTDNRGDNAVTLYLRGTTLFGGIDIR